MKKSMYIHVFLGMAIMMVCYCISKWIVFDAITPVGVQVLGVFAGTIYLWITIDPIVASLLAIAMLALSDYGPAGSVLTSCIGNATVIQMLFMMIFMAGLSYRGVTNYVARYLITRKIVEHRPWIFTFVIFVSSYLLSVFVNVFLPVLLFWPVLYEVFNQVGYKKDDAYPQIMISAVGLISLIGFPVAPYMGNALVLLGNYQSLLKNYDWLSELTLLEVNQGRYFLFCFLLGFVIIVCLLLILRFLFKPDMRPLKSLTIEMIEKDPLPEMTGGQIIYGALLIVFILAMLLPSVLPNALGMLKNNAAVIPVIMVVAVLLVKEHGEPLLPFNVIMGREFSWSAFWLCSSAILLGGAVTNESTGIVTMLSSVLSPIFLKLEPGVFAVIMVVSSIILTNFCNSLIIGMILQPIVLTYCNIMQVIPVPYIVLLSVSVLSTAFCTPAANPIAAMVFSNKDHIKTQAAYKYAVLMVISEMIIIMLSIPLCSVVLGIQ